MTDKPEFVTNDMLEYLDELRESGITNMFGARPYVEEEFSDLLDSKQAGEVLSYWMKTFSERHSKE